MSGTAWGSLVKTDSLYYQIFATAPHLFFDLIGQPASRDHRFDSVEVKQTAFRIDGVFLPEPAARDRTVYFVEVQFQPDDALYQRLFAEIALFLKHHPETQAWQATVLLARRSFEPPQSAAYAPLLSLPNVNRLYLDEPPARQQEPFVWGLMRLIVGPAERAAERARQLIQAARAQPAEASLLIELVETTLAYKFPDLGLEEIAKMLGIATTASQTRVYQEGRVEGLAEGRVEGRAQECRLLISKLLPRRVGEIPADLSAQVEGLSLEQLEALAEALLDFRTLADLQAWLQANA